MNILYITSSLRAPNGVCANNIIEALQKKGHKLFVFTQNNGDSEVKCSCKVVYSKHQSIYAIKEKIKKTSIGKKIQSVIDNLYRIWIVMCYPIWPFNSPIYAFLFAREANRVAVKKKIDMVITEYGDITCLNAGRYIKKKAGKIKAVAYFIDALYCGAKPSHMSEKTKKKLSLYWENKMLKDFDKVIMMEAAKGKYSRLGNEINYKNKLSFLDIPMYIPQDNCKNIKKDNKDFTTFVYVGSMPRNIRNPEYLFKLFRSINNKNWVLHIYGRNEYMNLFEKYANCNIEYKGVVSHDEAIKVISEADYLINIGNSFPEMVPSKIFEYMSAGKPIISTYKINDDPCIKYLKLYGNAICLDERATKDNKNIFIDFVEDLDNYMESIENSSKSTSINKRLYNNMPDAFVNCLEKEKLLK